MKAIILAGGLGTRISEETDFKPKPMINIGSMPILWHIMKMYSNYGVNSNLLGNKSWAVITGGSDGIGLAMAKNLAK